MLRELESSNVFLIPQDRTRQWYRYHPLFREFLLGELRRDEPEIVPELHARAADWYESHESARDGHRAPAADAASAPDARR